MNRLHTIKRYMEKRKLTRNPSKFLETLLYPSHNTEDLMAELEQPQVNIESVKRILEIATKWYGSTWDRNIWHCSVCNFDRATSSILKIATVHLMNASKSFQRSFNLKFLRKEFDYQASFEKISKPWKLQNQGLQIVLWLHMKTREAIRFKIEA